MAMDVSAVNNARPFGKTAELCEKHDAAHSKDAPEVSEDVINSQAGEGANTLESSEDKNAIPGDGIGFRRN